MSNYFGYSYLCSFPKYEKETLLLVVQSDIEQYIDKFGGTSGREITAEELKTALIIFTSADRDKQSESYDEMIKHLASLRNVKGKNHLLLKVTEYNKPKLDDEDYDAEAYASDILSGNLEVGAVSAKKETSEHPEVNLPDELASVDVEMNEQEQAIETDIIEDSKEIVDEEDQSESDDILQARNIYEYLAYQHISDANYKENSIIEYDRFTYEGYKQIASRTIFKNIDRILSHKKNKKLSS